MSYTAEGESVVVRTAKGTTMTKEQAYAQAERLVLRLRQRIFDYYEESEAKGQKASRVLEKALARQARHKPSPKTDQWGATAADRRMLARHGMAWGD